ncbi:MASE3 domain-containing protein [Senegalia massiliensis]|uniref:MASE3 domain-containing protein n=1 Tax=Senegalia massiliensis TaxID=1720316 RepID=UPI001031BDB6|nr:MASE3 domain-containing protein [Senegalia massiliensis]
MFTNKFNIDTNVTKFHTIITAILCMIIIIFVRFSSVFNIFLDQQLFLVLHTIFEILSVLVSFSIFLALYNIYDFTNSIRNVIFANTFYIVGLLDIMHFLSYSGMPMFLTENLSQKATSFWIFARIIMAVGLLCASIFKKETITKVNKRYFILLSTIFTIVLGYLVIYNSSIIPTFFDEKTGLTMTKIVLEYIVMLLLIVSMYVIYKTSKEKNSILTRNMLIAITIAIASEIIFTMYIDVHDSINLLGHVFKVISYFIIFRVLFIENIKDPYRKASEMREQLNNHVIRLEDIAKQKTKEMAIANYKLKNMNNKMLKELDAAKQIQMALVPKKYENHLGIKFYSEYIPWGKLSGDSYKYFKIDEKNLGMFLIDVSGHGVSSAMLTIFADRVLTPFDAEVEEDKEFYLNPKEVLKDFYEVFNESDFPEETHMVMLYGVLNIETSEFTYSSAGLNCNPIHIKNNGEIQLLELKDGFPICKLGSIFVPDYHNETIKLGREDRILFFTDGVIEETNNTKEQYGLSRLKDLIKDKSYLNSKGLLKKICDDLTEFRGEAQMEDDITMYIMDFTKR